MAEHINHGAWIGLIVAVVVWQLLVRPGVAEAIEHDGGISVPLLVLAGAFGAVGAGLGSRIWRALRDR
jgi:hypothetical protein